jgi:hypothetical protein
MPTQPRRDILTATRRALHGVAELVLAGPQYRRTGEIQLRVRPDGFATFTAPDLRLAGVELVVGGSGGPAGRRIPLAGNTFRALAEAAGVEVGAPADLYHDGSGVSPDDPIEVDPTAAAYLEHCFAQGDAALHALAPDEQPILWPEHFDVGVTVDEVNYGVSPGDGYLAEPYAYVGPWQRRTGAFWSAPFGAARPMREFAGLDALVAFFTEGRDRVRTDPVAGAG